MGKTTRVFRYGDYFFFMSWLSLITVLVAFGWSIGTGSYIDFEPMPPYLIAHGIVLTAWFIWFALQTTLVFVNRTSLHRQTGKIGVLIALAVLATTPAVTLNNPARLKGMGLDWESDMSEFPALGVEGTTMHDFVLMLLGGNFAALLLFGLFFGGAIYWRNRIDFHKRLMLLSSLMLLPPALARISRWPGLGGEDGTLVPAVFLVMLASLAFYDFATTKRLHKVTVVGLALIVAVNLLAFAIAGSVFGQELARSLA